MKKSISIIILAISVIVDIIALISYIKCLLRNWLGISMDMAASIKIIVIVITTATIFVCLHYLLSLMKEELIEAGTHEIPCAFVPYLRYKARRYKIIVMLRMMHYELYHTLVESKKEVLRRKQQRPQEQRDNPLPANEAKPELNQLLNCFHQIWYEIMELDLSISFYLSEMENGNTVLTRCLFLPSQKERNRGHDRQLNYKYIIHNCNGQRLSDYASNADHYIRENRHTQYKKNSIFDYVLTTRNPFWMSNDLSIDQAGKNFYTSSEYYRERYNSLAVFAIIPPGNANNPHNAIKGLLTFDSRKTNVFCEEECTILMGYMAHLLYDLLESLN